MIFPFKRQGPVLLGRGLQRVEKVFSTRWNKFFEPFIRFKKLMMENERNPSWVPLVTLFLPAAQVFPFFDGRKAPSQKDGAFLHLITSHHIRRGLSGKPLFFFHVLRYNEPIP